MKSFFTKIAVVISFSTFALTMASTSHDPFQEVQNALLKPTSLPFNKLVLDFSDPMKTTVSTASCLTNLIRAEKTGTLDPLALAYNFSEIIAGYVRAKPDTCSELYNFVRDPNAMYSAWSKGLSTASVVSAELQSLGDMDSCQELVGIIVQNYMPGILGNLGADASQTAIIQTALFAVEPAVAALIYAGYHSAYAVAQAGEQIANAIEEQMSACCGCFGSSKPSKKLTRAANQARALTAITPVVYTKKQ